MNTLIPALPTPPVSREALLGFFDDLGLRHTTYDHIPIFTVEEGEHLKVDMPGGHSKNLFLKDKKGNILLISALQSSEIPLKHLHRALGCGRLSFGNADLLEACLGVTPGSVTAYAIINDPNHRVRFILDAALMKYERVNFHPLKNDATTAMSPDDLLTFITALGRTPEVIDFTQLDLDAQV
ncbi:prolyl-tRNA synthetase associated domain-containing protein [Woodsholea maritima]|uniref:prolyl-tRNA synthetase associated domain-containing protein n=1 Tax=Woodsholea maritima TaxID=240237 RepID=UPI000370939D|nr:prolyl-tRNA synthetase associated domain-containing protein [Woodsholea maritima]